MRGPGQGVGGKRRASTACLPVSFLLQKLDPLLCHPAHTLPEPLQVFGNDAPTRPLALGARAQLAFPLVSCFKSWTPHVTNFATPALPPLQMFGDDAPPLSWDSAREYSRRAVELYYLANAGKQLTNEQLVQAMAGRWPKGLDRWVILMVFAEGREGSGAQQAGGGAVLFGQRRQAADQ